ncbi:heme-dependent oxidative N-demethylase subunit alpha family protein [Phenylobacterium soli]|uniref:DUF3445 domain-containing protein n=1 Tax=Phenylobacterium soli TaxID=2170551 RepID=A0A328AGJ0_9CAUL|nr:heme-dependent oxidative N-demethylase subunit alpha family protein [Phenylobacterium soli]RAK53637.1 hypothetical protein DJ017_03395 [Phenylobacterium soli]
MSLPHRPWEDGGDFSIGLKPITEAQWLEGGEAEPWRRKDPLFASVPALVWAEAPGSREAQQEVLELVEAAIGPADPQAEGPGQDWPPLYAAARRVSDDLCLMQKIDGEWRLTALSLSAGSFFKAGEVVGRSLAELHGPVNGFGGRFLTRVQRIFEGLRPDLILERRNWTVLNTPELHTPDSGPIRARIGEIDAAEAGRALSLRVERQTLRRLPRTGGALFTIRVWVGPLASVAQSPERLAAFTQAWRSATPDFRAYKRFDLYDELVEAFVAGARAEAPEGAA